MSNPHRGEVEVELAGRRFTMRASFGAIAEIESKTGEGVAALAERMLGGKPKTTDVAAVVWAGLRAAGEPASYEKVGEMVFEAGLGAVLGPAAEFLVQACTGGKPPGEAKATEAEPG